jgi:hypothetical protein
MWLMPITSSRLVLAGKLQFGGAAVMVRAGQHLETQLLKERDV